MYITCDGTLLSRAPKRTGTDLLERCRRRVPGSRRYHGNGLGRVAGVNQRGSVSSSREDLGDQMPIVEDGFLLQPIADSR